MTQVAVLTPEQIEALVDRTTERVLAERSAAMPPEVVELEKLKRKEYLTTNEVEKLYPLNANTLRKRRTNGEGPAYSKDGDNVVYSQAAIRKYLESRRQKTHDQP